MRSFRVRMTIVIAMVVLVISGLLSVFGYQRAKDSLSAQLEEKNSLAAEKYAQELNAWVNTHATILDTLATEIKVGKIYDQDRTAFHQFLEESYKILNPKGEIYDIYFTFPDNTMACASDFVVDGTVDYVHDRDWYTMAARTQELFYSTPYMDSDTKQPIITISKAVYEGGTLQGVLATDIFVDTLVRIISEAEVAPGSYAFLVDGNMGMVVHPDQAYAFEDTPRGIMDIADSPYSQVVSLIQSDSKETVYVKDFDGVNRGIVVTRMSNTGWYVGIATSKEELLQSISGLLRAFIIATVLVVIVGGLAAVLLAHEMDKLRRQQLEHEEHVLQIEKQAADEASKAKSRFLADMSHEIRTPINAILGMNEMILRETDSRDIIGYSRNIRQSGHNLLQLVNSILDFSKIEYGKMEIIPEHYQIKSQIAYVINSVAERARIKQLELILDIDPTLPTELYGDDIRINEIIMNILTNAVKYTEKGSITFTVKVKERKDDPEKNVLIYVEVKDTGIGIKEEDMERLFASFERLDEDKNRHIEGTGLGIAITTRLLTLMNSELKVESRYGEGSRFYFELWQKVINDAPLGEYSHELDGDEEDDTYKEIFRAPSARILIVDDTKMNIAVAVNLLKRTAIQIDTALSGAQAVRQASENAYDLILMDQRMPEMDGTEALLKIRALENKKNEKTPIICLTADVIQGAREKYIAEGFNDYLTKPVDGCELEKMLFDYLPKEKILIERVNEDKKDDTIQKSGSAELFASLAKAGVDVKSGLFFCQQDEEMYKSILAEYSLEQRTKSLHLQNCYERRDWKNYEIYAHSLKSTSKTIGAKKLYEYAADLEAAAGRGDELVLEEGHGKVMELYSRIAKVIETDLGVVHTGEEEEEEVFEFLPEGTDDQQEDGQDKMI